MELAESIVIAAPPSEVWKVGGDAGAVADWIPALETSRLEGDRRYVTFADGEHPDGSRVDWTAAFTAASSEVERQLHEGVGDIYRGGLVELKRRLEG